MQAHPLTINNQLWAGLTPVYLRYYLEIRIEIYAKFYLDINSLKKSVYLLIYSFIYEYLFKFNGNLKKKTKNVVFFFILL